jgi:hypothetical protein
MYPINQPFIVCLTHSFSAQNLGLMKAASINNASHRARGSRLRSIVQSETTRAAVEQARGGAAASRKRHLTNEAKRKH